MSGPRLDGTGTAARGAAPPTSPVALVIISWAIVGVPALWGVAQTVIKSLALFR